MSEGRASSDGVPFSFEDFEAWYEEQKRRFLEPALKLVTKALDEHLDSAFLERERERVRVSPGRVKSSARTWKKLNLEQYACRLSALNDIPMVIDDLVATRIICTNTSDLNSVWELLLQLDEWDGHGDPVLAIEPDSQKDFVETPKQSGYRAFHINLKTSVNAGLRREVVTCELQLRTLLQDSWGELTHEDTYKPDSSVSPLVTTLSRRMADLLATLDDIAEDLRGELDQMSDAAVQSEVDSEPLPDDLDSNVVAAQSYLRKRVEALERPIDLASLAWELQREFGQSVTEDWLGFGSFKSLLRSSAPDARVSRTPPSFVIPDGFQFDDKISRTQTDLPFVATVLKRVDRSFPFYSVEDWPHYFEWLSRSLLALGVGGDRLDARTFNQLTRVARDEAAQEGQNLARGGFSYVARALLFARCLEAGITAAEIGETFFEMSINRAREAVSVTREHEEDFRHWLGLPTRDD